jgi:Na+-transporting methylmalonyl-CoA/oxaloacetate decarboxylase gamma subunit
LEALIPLLAVFKDPVNVVLLLVIIGMGWFIKTSRSEDREDKEKMVNAIKSLDETLDAVKNILAAMTGKPS